MADKKYYWLKLKRDFFKRHDVRIIEEMPNGKDYLLFYLKLLLESIDHEGELRFSETIPYDNKMLSIITNTNIDVVKSALDVFTGLHMIEIFDDNTLFMTEVQRLIGCESSAAERVRKHREKRKALQCNTDETKCNIEIDKEIEKDKEIDIEIEKKEKTDYQQIIDLYNAICVSLPSVRSLSNARKKEIKARLNTYSIDDIKQCFENAEASSFLKGDNDRKWTASFDWIMKDSNFAKVLDGNYTDKADSGNSSFDIKEFFEAAVARGWGEKEEPKTAGNDENIRARAEALQANLAGK